MMDKNFRDVMKVINRHFSKHFDAHMRTLIESLLEAAFMASMITDEGRNVSCSISVFDSTELNADAPEIIRSDRWTIIPLADPIALTPEQLARLSQAVRPQAGALAVRPTVEGGWNIWAIIDQEHLVQGFRNYKEDAFYPRAGRFQIEVESLGSIAVYHNSMMLAHLHREKLTESFQNVFNEGPLAEALEVLADQHVKRTLKVMEAWPEAVHNAHRKNQKSIGVPIELIEIWLDRAKERWFAALSEILLEIRHFHHGGAILLIPKAKFTDLNLKYKIDYHRAEEALSERCASEIMELGYRHFGLDTEDSEQLHTIIPEVNEAELRKRDAARAQAGAIQFVASLSGVDGLILAVHGINISGFGVEILTKQDPKTVFLASNPSGSVGEPIDPTRWGTRHRSMMRYCFKHRGSIGFVVSQDADVRAMMRVEDRLLVWPNINLDRSATLPFEAPCERCSSVGGFVPIGLVVEDDVDLSNS